MSLPFQLHCTISSPQLYERRDGRFQQLEPGAIGPLISGYRYLLVERSLGLFLQSLEIPCVRYEDAVIFDPENDKDPYRVDCADSSAPHRQRATEVLHGVSNVDQCASGVGYAYSERQFTVCVEDVS